MSISNQPEWRISQSPISYPQAVADMEARVAAIQAGKAGELVWLLEHPPLYTAGTSARVEDLLANYGLPVYATGRGGQYTWHGPGQRVAYAMLDLNRRGRDLRLYVRRLEEWIIRALARFGVAGERRCGRTGVWVARKDANGQESGRDDKIAAIGVRVKRWVTLHGIAINVAPDLSYYQGIVPCGIREHGVTSLAALGHAVTLSEIDAALRSAWNEAFEKEPDAICPGEVVA